MGLDHETELNRKLVAARIALERVAYLSGRLHLYFGHVDGLREMQREMRRIAVDGAKEAGSTIQWGSPL